MAGLQEPVTQITRMWSDLSWVQRLAASATLILGVALFSGLAYWSSRQNYAPLMTNLSPEDLDQITQRLTADHVPFRTAAGGSAVLVPEDLVHDQRMRMAGEGLPRGGNVGFEMFDAPNFGMSHFAEELNYRRGLEGELRRTIRNIDAVKDARVHLVVAEKALFRDQEQPASASVTLTLHQGRKLTGGQVQAVVHLVSASVAGLPPERVTVVDQSGTILSKNTEGNGEAGSTLERQHNIERGLEERVSELLVPIVGTGHSVVRVSANLDFSQTDRTSETYDPSATALRSEQVSDEQRTAAMAPTGGIPGARSNLTGVQKGTADLGGGPATRKLETRNFEINKVVQRDVAQPGRLTRLSVAVLLDGITTTGEDGSKKMTERTPEELARINEVVRRAVGFDADRDDQVVVQSMVFDTPAAAEVVAADPMWLRLVDRYWLPVILSALGVALMVSIMRRDTRSGGLPLPQVLDIPRSVRELEQVIETGGLSFKTPMGQAAMLAANTPPGLAPTAAAAVGAHGAQAAPAAAVAMHARPEPDRAAHVLKGWLNEA